jgi:hypothetical protein
MTLGPSLRGLVPPTRRALRALALWTAALAFPSCVAPENNKLGADGEACFTDTDCRDGLLCIQGLCRDEEEEEPLYTCAQSCRYLSDCGIEQYAACLDACETTTAGWDAQDFNSFGDCLFSKTCDDLQEDQAESCFP